MIIKGFFSALIALAVLVQPTSADETCMSPYMAKIVGQEDYVYIWTLGLEGVGDGEDKLVTVDVNPDSETCLLYTSPSPRDRSLPRMPSSA